MKRNSQSWIEDELRQNCIEIEEEQAFLTQWQAKATRSETKEWLQYLLDQTPAAASTTQPVITGPKQVPVPGTTGQKLEAQVARQPAHRIKRLERQEQSEQIQAHGLEIIERYGLDKRRPTVKVGYSHKKRR